MSARARSSTAGPSSAVAQLPDYEPPTHPLNATGQRALNNLLAQKYQQQLQQHLRDATQLLNNSASLINDRLTTLKENTKKRKERHPDPEEHDQYREDHLQDFQKNVEIMTQRVEEAVRKTIDGQESAKVLEETLRHVKQQAANNATASQRVSQTQHSQRRRDDDDASEFDPTLPGTAQVAAPSALFKQRVQAESTHYQSLSLATRYSHHNDYVGFKNMVHDASYPPDQQPPLPPKHTWFPSAGPPAPGTTRDVAGDDNDIEIAKETISTKCPLTLQEFREPVMSRNCSHTFEKAAIVDMIRNDGTGGQRGRGPRTMTCPASGCNAMLTERDLYSDDAKIYKIRRIQKHREAEASYAAYEDDDEGSTSHHGQRAQSIHSDASAEDIENIERRVESQAYTQRVKAERATATPFVGSMDGAAYVPRRSQVADLGSGNGEESE